MYCFDTFAQLVKKWMFRDNNNYVNGNYRFEVPVLGRMNLIAKICPQFLCIFCNRQNKEFGFLFNPGKLPVGIFAII